VFELESTKMLESLRDQLKPAILSKLNEFEILGYESVQEDDIWKFLLMKKWRKLKEDDIQLHKLVNDILSVRIQEYMTFITVEAFQTPSSELSSDDLKELLK
jgi:Post-transcriptional regulator